MGGSLSLLSFIFSNSQLHVHIDVTAFPLQVTILHNQVPEVKKNPLIFSFRCFILKVEFMGIYRKKQ
jgi:hypothetical protein